MRNESEERREGMWNNMCKSALNDHNDYNYDLRKKPRIFSKEGPESDKNIRYQQNEVRVKPIELMKKKLSDYVPKRLFSNSLTSKCPSS